MDAIQMSAIAIAIALFVATVPLLAIAFYDAHKHQQRKQHHVKD